MANKSKSVFNLLFLFLFLLIVACNSTKKIEDKAINQPDDQALSTSKISTDSELHIVKTKKRWIKSSKDFTYLVDTDYQTIIAYDPDSNIQWKVNIIEKCGEPAVGKPEIRYIKLEDKVLQIVFGKHDFANVVLSSGKVNYLGVD